MKDVYQWKLIWHEWTHDKMPHKSVRKFKKAMRQAGKREIRKAVEALGNLVHRGKNFLG